MKVTITGPMVTNDELITRNKLLGLCKELGLEGIRHDDKFRLNELVGFIIYDLEKTKYSGGRWNVGCLPLVDGRIHNRYFTNSLEEVAAELRRAVQLSKVVPCSKL